MLRRYVQVDVRFGVSFNLTLENLFFFYILNLHTQCILRSVAYVPAGQCFHKFVTFSDEFCFVIYAGGLDPEI